MAVQGPPGAVGSPPAWAVAFHPGAAAMHPEEEVFAVCVHHLSCTSGLDNNYWERLKKKKSLSNNYSLKKLAGGKENTAWITLWPPPLRARRAAVAKNGRKHICNAFM